MITRENGQVGVGLETKGEGGGRNNKGRLSWRVRNWEGALGPGEIREKRGGEGAYHTRQDEVNASASPVSDAIDGASLT